MDYQDFSTEDFVLDREFRNWVLGLDNKSNDFWADWIAKNPDKLQSIKEARQMVLKMAEVNYSLSDKKVRDIWKAIEDHFENNPARDDETKLVSISPEAVIYSTGERLQDKKSNRFSYLWKVAAILIIAIGVSFFLFKEQFPDQQVVPPAQIVKSNPLGQKSAIFLSDGSEAILNSGSTLTYDENFGLEKRVIHLQGEAYFKVAHDEDHPFIVKSGNIETTALGTEFNVRAYHGEPISVALTKGKVSVVDKIDGYQKSDSLILTQGEGAKYDDEKTLTRFDFNEKEYTSWINGVLYFHQASEEEVIQKLEKWYGVKIEVANDCPRQWGYTGEFNRKSLEAVLTSMSFAMEFTFTIENDYVKLKYNANAYEAQ